MPDVCQGCTSKIAKYEQELQDLRRQLELANEKINELEVSILYTITHTLVKIKFDMSEFVSKKEDDQTKLFNMIRLTFSIIFPIWVLNILNPFGAADKEIYSIVMYS